jgi:hypothetical protein
MDPALTAAAHTVGIPGAVILALSGIVLYAVRAIIRGKLVPERYYQEALERGENYRLANASLVDQLRELTTNQDLALEMLTALRAHAEVKRGDHE